MKNFFLALGFSLFATVAIADPGTIIIIDGDTIKVDGESIRIVGMDTPETYSPSPACSDYERRKGFESAGALNHLLTNRKVLVERTGKKDKYGRSLAVVYVGVPKKNVADIMIEAGFARKNNGEKRLPWCP